MNQKFLFGVNCAGNDILMTNKIVFISELSKWRECKEVLLLAGPFVVITPDFELLHHLYTVQQPAVNMWDFLSGGEIETNEEDAWDVCERLAPLLRNKFCYKVTDFVERCRNDVFFIINAVLNIFMAAKRVLESYKPDEVLLLDFPYQPIYWDPPTGSSGVFDTSIAILAEDKGVKSRTITCPTTAVVGKKGEKSQAQLDAVEFQSLDAGHEIIGVALFEGVFFQELDLLLDNLAKRENRESWIVIADQPLRQSLPFVDMRSLRRLPFTKLLDREPADKNDLRATILTTLVRILKDKSNFNYGRIIDLIASDFADWLVDASRHYLLGSLVVDAFAPHIALASYDIYGRNRCMAEPFLNHNIPMISIDHVCLATKQNARRNKGARCAVAVWGDIDKALHRSFRDDGAQVMGVGSLRRDIDVLMDSKRLKKGDSNSNEYGKTVVIFTSQTTHCAAMWTWAPPNKLASSWDQLITLFGRHRDWHFIIKSHPRGDYQNYYREAIVTQLTNVHLEEGRSSEALSNADIAVLMNIPSKVSLDSVATNVPVIYLHDAVLPNFDSPLNNGDILNAESVDVLEQQLIRLLSDRSFYQSTVNREHLFLQRALRATGADAFERLNMFMNKLLNRKSARFAHIPTPAARWLMDFVMIVGDFRAERLKGISFVKKLNRWCECSQQMDVSSMNYLNVDELGVYFIEELSGYEWNGHRWTRAIALLLVYRSLPRAWRPSLRVLLYNVKTLEIS